MINLRTTDPSQFVTKTGVVDKAKCDENMEFWKARYPDPGSESDYAQTLALSEKVLPCHTFGFHALKSIFGFDDVQKKFKKNDAKVLSAKSLLTKLGKSDYSPGNLPDHMKESIDLNHDIFVFAYHGVHNPYQRVKDDKPIRPFGVFLKKNIETFATVHGCPWDVNSKNINMQDDIINKRLDKYYLLPDDLRTLKASQISSIPQLKNNFWYYFGNPDDWGKEKGYGNRLYYYAGEMRYLNEISHDSIAAVLWPFGRGEHNDATDNNLDLLNEFEKTFSIPVIRYTYDLYNNNWALAVVEASYYSQQYYLKFGKFESNALVAKLKFNEN